MAAGTMNIKLVRDSGVAFTCISGQGHQVRLDGPPSVGGQDSGTRPMEMVLMGLAGCSAVDLVLILEKMRLPPGKMEISVDATRADAVPAVFTDIHMTFKASGVPADKLQRAADLSVEKYCSVAHMLQPKVKITWSVEVV